MVETINFIRDRQLPFEEYDDCFYELSKFIKENDFPKVRIYIVGEYVCVCLGLRNNTLLTDCDAYVDPYTRDLSEAIREIGYRHGNSDWLNNHIDELANGFSTNAPTFNDIFPFLDKLFIPYKSYYNLDLYIATTHFILYLKLISALTSTNYKHAEDFINLFNKENLTIEKATFILRPYFSKLFPNNKFTEKDLSVSIQNVLNGDLNSPSKSIIE